MCRKNIPLVSYIIPVYKASSYIEKCVVSLLSQTYSNIEYIFIEDCSPDNSVELLVQTVGSFPYRKEYVNVIRLPRNIGSSSVRNIGLDIAVGEYVMFADSDDWIEESYVADMVTQIEKEDADIIYCDYIESFKYRERYIVQGYGTDALSCVSAMLKGDMHGSTCNKIYRRAFLSETRQRFVDGADLYEDIGWNIRLFAVARKIGYISNAYYHYIQYNEESIIKSMHSLEKARVRTQQRIRNVDVACKFMEEKGLIKGLLLNDVKKWKLMAKNDILTGHPYSWLRWVIIFPEADEIIWQCASITWNYKLMLSYLHYHCFWMYNVHRNILGMV